MTFWQENYGFVKEVYDYRMVKYQEWMDNLEAIVSKVLAPNIQYTYREFKNIQDSLGSLCRDLEKEGMKDWLDMMLEKVALRVSDEGGSTARDKEFKATERKRLQGLIDRHDSLLPPTKETQDKVEIFARCYAFGDDISTVLKTLEEMRHLSTKEIHPHNMSMLEEQIERADKVIGTIESVADQYEEFIKRGQKLLKTPNCAPFLEGLLEKLEVTWKEANEKSKIRLKTLSDASKDWESYDDMRAGIIEPCEKLESEFKKYRKYYDPSMGAKNLTKRKGIWEECNTSITQMDETIKKCYETIVILAGEEKKEFLDRELADVKEKMQIVAKSKTSLDDLQKYNDELTKSVDGCRELNDWTTVTNRKLKELCTSEDLSPEDRVKEILNLQSEANEKFPLLEPLEAEYKRLLTDEDFEISETARSTMTEFEDMKEFATEVIEDIHKEAGSISQDQRLYADYLCSVKEIKPWMEEAEKSTTEPLHKPSNLEEALALLTSCEEFGTNCSSQKEKLEAAAQARESMEKPSSAENESAALTTRWDGVKKIAEERIEKVQVLVNTWKELQETTEDLAGKMNEVPKQDEPNLEELEKVFNSMKGLFAKKKELLAGV